MKCNVCNTELVTAVTKYTEKNVKTDRKPEVTYEVSAKCKNSKCSAYLVEVGHKLNTKDVGILVEQYKAR